MEHFKTQLLTGLLSDGAYLGRGIMLGKSADGKNGVAVYFLMGRSQNSRNRIFARSNTGIDTRFFDCSLVGDPSLVIYSPVKQFQNKLIVTNGDQTDTVLDFLKTGGSFAEALSTREFEPDAPNFTPRISGLMTFDKEKQDCAYSLSILKSSDQMGTACDRFYFDYVAQNGVGHFLHTYIGDGNPLPSFCGEPKRVYVPNQIESFSEEIWQSLNFDNKISLYVRFTDLKTGETQERLFNKNTK